MRQPKALRTRVQLPPPPPKFLKIEKKITTKTRTVDDTHKKYRNTEKGKKAQEKARKKYDEADLERRRSQKREYMRKKRREDPGYCKWK